MDSILGALKGIGLLILFLIAIPFAWIAFTYIASPFVPPNTFSLTCTYDLTYRLNVTIAVAEREYSSEAVYQQSRSRDWISVMNSAGCLPTHGAAVPFKLADNRVVLLRSHLCPAAQRQLAGRWHNPSYSDSSGGTAESRRIDVTKLCIGISRERPYSGRFTDGFVIDNADHPTRWKGFEFGDPLPETDDVIRLISVTAEAADIWPADDLDRIAPAVLKTNFKYKSWSDSPEAILNFFRRYNPDKKFTYQAEHY